MLLCCQQNSSVYLSVVNGSLEIKIIWKVFVFVILLLILMDLITSPLSLSFSLYSRDVLCLIVLPTAFQITRHVK